MINLSIKNIDIIYNYIAHFKIRYDSLSCSTDFLFTVEEILGIYQDVDEKESSIIRTFIYDDSLLKNIYYIFILQEPEFIFLKNFEEFKANTIFL